MSAVAVVGSQRFDAVPAVATVGGSLTCMQYGPYCMGHENALLGVVPDVL